MTRRLLKLSFVATLLASSALLLLTLVSYFRHAGMSYAPLGAMVSATLPAKGITLDQFYSAGISRGWIYVLWSGYGISGTLPPDWPTQRMSLFVTRSTPPTTFLDSPVSVRPGEHSWVIFDYTYAPWQSHGKSSSPSSITVQDADLRVRVSGWGIALPMVVLTGWLWRMLRLARLRDWRRQTNRCASCGYDLRATPERCPECGAVPLARG